MSQGVRWGEEEGRGFWKGKIGKTARKRKKVDGGWREEGSCETGAHLQRVGEWGFHRERGLTQKQVRDREGR